MSDVMDNGCKAATEFLHHQSRCFDCPFTKCLQDVKRGAARLKKHLRDAEIRRARREGATILSLSKKFHVSERTIRRALGEATMFFPNFENRGESDPPAPACPRA